MISLPFLKFYTYILIIYRNFFLKLQFIKTTCKVHKVGCDIFINYTKNLNVQLFSKQE